MNVTWHINLQRKKRKEQPFYSSLWGETTKGNCSDIPPHLQLSQLNTSYKSAKSIELGNTEMLKKKLSCCPSCCTKAQGLREHAHTLHSFTYGHPVTPTSDCTKHATGTHHSFPPSALLSPLQQEKVLLTDISV